MSMMEEALVHPPLQDKGQFSGKLTSSPSFWGLKPERNRRIFRGLERSWKESRWLARFSASLWTSISKNFL